MDASGHGLTSEAAPPVRSPDEIRQRLASAWAEGLRGDADLNPGMTAPGPLRDAAVLVPLVDRPAGPTVLLTERSPNLAEHAGQISFPGGRREAWDTSVEANALRETSEEIGVPATAVDVLGRLDTYVTGTGFRIAPVVGMLRPPLDLVPDPIEVAAVFEVPLAFIREPANLERHSRELRGRQRDFYAFTFGRWFIWGATAAILVNLRDALA
jgi:8-oxo-dGTP pyrophosphatase MutT (NUDIX family)